MTLIGYWPLNESSGDAIDYSGQGNNGVVESVERPVNGLLGADAYNFDNTGYIQVPYSNSFYSNDLSISMWINLNSLSRVNDKLQRHIDSRTPQSWDDGYIIQTGDENNLDFSVRGSGRVSTNNLTENTWHHVTCIHSTSQNSIRLYIDGKLEDETATENQIIDSGRKLTISERSDKQEEHTDGKISEVRIYNRPLTKSEIQYLYSVGKRGLQTTSKKSS